MKTLTATSLIGLTLILSAGMVTQSMAGHRIDSDDKERSHKRHEHKNSFYDYARVVKVKTIYKQVKVAMPQKECWDEHRDRPINRHASQKNAEKALVGGIIGGVIGHHLGKNGHADGSATVVGALIGAAVGHESGRHDRNTYRTRKEHTRRCQTHTEYRHEKRADGYRVTYRYHGETFHTRMRHRPGKRLRINVKISLAD